MRSSERSVGSARGALTLVAATQFRGRIARRGGVGVAMASTVSTVSTVPTMHDEVQRDERHRDQHPVRAPGCDLSATRPFVGLVSRRKYLNARRCIASSLASKWYALACCADCIKGSQVGAIQYSRARARGRRVLSRPDRAICARRVRPSGFHARANLRSTSTPPASCRKDTSCTAVFVVPLDLVLTSLRGLVVPPHLVSQESPDRSR